MLIIVLNKVISGGLKVNCKFYLHYVKDAQESLVLDCNHGTNYLLKFEFDYNNDYSKIKGLNQFNHSDYKKAWEEMNNDLK